MQSLPHIHIFENSVFLRIANESSADVLLRYAIIVTDKQTFVCDGLRVGIAGCVAAGDVDDSQGDAEPSRGSFDAAIPGHGDDPQ